MSEAATGFGNRVGLGQTSLRVKSGWKPDSRAWEGVGGEEAETRCEGLFQVKEGERYSRTLVVR